jgi:hypothetical protein
MEFPQTHTNAWGTVTTHVFRRVMWGNVPATYAEITGSELAYFGDRGDVEILQRTDVNGHMAFVYTDTNPVIAAANRRLAELGAWVKSC